MSSQQFLTQTEIAKKVKKDVSAISRIVTKEKIPKVNRKIDFGKYGHLFSKPKQQITHVIKDLRGDLRGENSREKEEEIAHDFSAMSLKLQKTFLASKANEMYYKSKVTELEYLVKSGKYIPRENVERAIADISISVKKAFQSLPRRSLTLFDKLWKEDKRKRSKKLEAFYHGVLKGLIAEIGGSIGNK